MSEQVLTPQVPGEAAAADEPKVEKTRNKAKEHTEKPVEPKLEKEPGFPDAKDVDASSIQRAVLTKDGYVVPQKPAQPKA